MGKTTLNAAAYIIFKMYYHHGRWSPPQHIWDKITGYVGFVHNKRKELHEGWIIEKELDMGTFLGGWSRQGMIEFDEDFRREGKIRFNLLSGEEKKKVVRWLLHLNLAVHYVNGDGVDCDVDYREHYRKWGRYYLKLFQIGVLTKPWL